jgi:uncharacterized SAM-binding protein YcdF (DUF218 family)
VHLIADFVKSYLVPGTVMFLMVGMMAGVLLLCGSDRLRRWGRAWLASLVILYWLMSIPLISDWLLARLSTSAVAEPAADVQKARAVVVLSNGVIPYRIGGLQVVDLGLPSAMNALEAARQYRLLGQPRVIVSGGIVDARVQQVPESEVLRDALVKLGVPADRILLESQSKNTREQAENCGALLRRQNLQPFVLVTAATHVSRAMAAFRAAGLTPIAVTSAAGAPAAVHSSLWDRLKPDEDTLEQSQLVAYEYFARFYYWMAN